MDEEIWRARATVMGLDQSEFATWDQFREAATAHRVANRAPFREAAAAAGITETYDRMTGKRSDDPRLFELALAHLRLTTYDDETRGWIARTFETRAADPYWDQLLQLFRSAPSDSDERDRLAAALSTCARSKHVADMLGIVGDESFGAARTYFLRPISRLGGTQGKTLIASLTDDPVLGREATAIVHRWSRDRG